jgi:hypothetical protein
MNSIIDAIIAVVLSIYLVTGMGIFVLVVWVRPRYPGWWKRNMVDVHPFDEEIERQAISAATTAIVVEF